MYLLKRGLAHLKPKDITVVEYDPERRALATNPVGARYRMLFGNGLDWHPEGFAEWFEHFRPARPRRSATAVVRRRPHD